MIDFAQERKQGKLLSLDSLFDGELLCWQYREGYRFSVDPVLLAHFKIPKRGAKVLDLGTGSGIIPLLLNYRYGECLEHIVGFERQDELVEIATQNILENGYGEKCSIVHGDLREIKVYFAPESFDMVLSNPPFFPLGRGRISQNLQAYQARHHIAGDLDDFFKATAFVLKNKASACYIYPAEHLSEMIAIARKYRLELKHLRPIYNYPEGENEARLVLAHFQKNGGLGVKMERPLYIYEEKNGDYSQEMLCFYASYVK